MKRIATAVLISELLCAPLLHATGPDTSAGNERLGTVRIVRGLSPEGPVVTLLGTPSRELDTTRELVSKIFMIPALITPSMAQLAPKRPSDARIGPPDATVSLPYEHINQPLIRVVNRDARAILSSLR